MKPCVQLRHLSRMEKGAWLLLLFYRYVSCILTLNRRFLFVSNNSSLLVKLMKRFNITPWTTGRHHDTVAQQSFIPRWCLTYRCYTKLLFIIWKNSCLNVDTFLLSFSCLTSSIWRKMLQHVWRHNLQFLIKRKKLTVRNINNSEQK